MNHNLLNRSIFGLYDKFLAFFILSLISDREDKKLIYQMVIFFFFSFLEKMTKAKYKNNDQFVKDFIGLARWENKEKEERRRRYLS